MQSSADRRLYVEVVLNHIIWSMYPLFSRYLQVKSEPQTMDVFVLLCSSKFTALLVIYFKFWIFGNDPIIIWNRRTIKNDNENDSDDVRIQEYPPLSAEEIAARLAQDDIEAQRKEKTLAQRWITAITYGVLATGRAMFAVLAARYAEAYKLVLITLLVPLLTSIADKLFLSKDLPKIIWPTLVLSLVGSFLTSFQFDVTALDKGHERGITYQCISALFQVLGRLLMKLSENTLPKHEINLAGSAFTFVVTFGVTLFMHPAYIWGVFFRMGYLSWFSWSFIAIMVFVVAYTSTVALCRKMGPALYSSIGGLRVVFTAFVGKIWLNEGIETPPEWVGAALVITSITWFMYGLHKESILKKREIEVHPIIECKEVIDEELSNASKEDEVEIGQSSLNSMRRQSGEIDSLSQILEIMNKVDTFQFSESSTTTTFHADQLQNMNIYPPILESDCRDQDGI